MAKAIKNKQYNEFWEDDKLDVKKSEKDDESKVSSEEIKKLEKKLSKKVSGLEKEIKEIKGEEKPEEEIKPVNPPRGWHARNEFIDEVGNKFEKGVYVGNVKEEKVEPKKVEPKKVEPKKVEPKKVEPKKEVKSEPKAKSEEPRIPSKKELEKLAPKLKKSAERVVPDSALKTPTIPKNTKPVVNKTTEKPKPLTTKDIYQQYITDSIPFKMYFRGNLIFDSKVQPLKNYPVFKDDGFILFGKNYIYRGIRIEKY